eukprot:m.229977 g.229977  ORF g.229977 m.229977 type:complete len:536 (+) comp15685_c0_seq11:6726-8333(+)
MCQAMEAVCYFEPMCRACLRDLYEYPDNSKAVLQSYACQSANPYVLDAFGDGFIMAGNCFAFPSYALAKRLCNSSAGCAACWQSVREDNNYAATQQCNSGRDATLINTLVSSCASNTLPTCHYWMLRCEKNTLCGSCLNVLMPARTSISATARALSSDHCVATLHDDTSEVLLENVVDSCPDTVISDCFGEVFFCVLKDSVCASCLDGSSGPQRADQCATLLASHDIASTCSGCPSSVSTINRIVLATTAVGSISVAACVLVILIIVAYSKDVHSMPDRIIIGMMATNAIYSLANAVPLNYLHTDLSNCGKLVLSFETIRWWRSWWFAGKYGLVCFEIFILYASVLALSRGVRSLPGWHEKACHAICAWAGIAAFLGFFLRCQQINESGYNAATQSEAEQGAYSHLNPVDDIDDDAASKSAAQRFQSGRSQYDFLTQRMLQVWIGLLGIAIFLWIYLRRLVRRLISLWRHSTEDAEREWDRDIWDKSQRGQLRTKQRLRAPIKDGYTEVARPLEPYVAVFILFGVPALVMATDYC